MLADLPVYPSRMPPAAGGGFWLTAFAARTQLVEFVLREPAYRRRMMAEIDPELLGRAAAALGRKLPRAAAGRASEDHGRAQAVGAAALLRAGDPPRRPTASRVYSLHSRVDGTNHGIIGGGRACRRRSSSLAKGPGRLLRLALADLGKGSAA